MIEYICDRSDVLHFPFNFIFAGKTVFFRWMLELEVNAKLGFLVVMMLTMYAQTLTITINLFTLRLLNQILHVAFWHKHISVAN